MYGVRSNVKLFRGVMDGSLKTRFTREACIVMGIPEHDKLTESEIQTLAALTGKQLLDWVEGTPLSQLPALTLMGVLDGIQEATEAVEEADRFLSAVENIGTAFVSVVDLRE